MFPKLEGKIVEAEYVIIVIKMLEGHEFFCVKSYNVSAYFGGFKFMFF